MLPRSVLRTTALSSRCLIATDTASCLVSASRPLSTSSPSTAPLAPSRPRRSAITTSVLLGLFGGATYLLGSLYPPETLRLLLPPPAPVRLDRDSPEGKAHMASIEKALLELDLVKKMSSASSPAPSPLPVAVAAEGDLVEGGRSGSDTIAVTAERLPHYEVSRPYTQYAENRRRHHFTAGTLQGPGLLAALPLVLSKTDAGAKAEGGYEGDSTVIVHLGRSMCGFEGVLHGGMIATVFDEALARTAFYALPARIGMTANLSIDFKKPVKADQYIAIHTRRVSAEGRKAIVEGEIVDLKGNVLAYAKGLFVQPKFARFVDPERVKKALDQSS